ncbi:Flp pilus assembly protein CpaB [Pseudomonas azotoformans]|uniref:Flp pilus assembly protein CpaB n=1 Tax=Pseudomonas azotoformans TaxID=47878 RepID=A0A1V2JFF7_PSEAZ|nr:Flp pilus assembly protein CpaB [Pseudomonas azotoformans]OIN51982.1 Flp pilus assembly protein CpaB [Pseudomonas azotoformans]ONH43979.1 Flp pilus assembly protein CpaB [Pseudomonas azotoformans]SDO62566.1 pilus assembly protein CpaB [Pseudomonas azotoformans]
MNSRISMVLAGLLLIGALIAGYWGLVLSRAPEPVAAPPAPVISVEKTLAAAEDQTRRPVVVLLHDVPAFTPLTAADLSVEKLRTVPAGSLTQLEQAIGRIPLRTLGAGTWLTEDSFSAGGPLARMIRPNERALAVAVDEVVGAGGQLSPGDYVDVLLFLRQDAGNAEQSAQIVLPAMRLLSVGDQLGLANDGKPAVPPPATAEERAQAIQRRLAARTVVLAVPEPLLSRLMLASQAGTLRLAVRSAEEQLLSRYWAGEDDTAQKLESANRDLYQFTQLALSAPPKRVVPAGVTPGVRRGIEVIRGAQAAPQTP